MDRTDGSAIDATIKVGGNVSGSGIIVGDRNRQSIGATALGAPAVKDLEDSLLAIRAVIENMKGPYAAIATQNVETAVNEARASKPDKSALSAAVDTALSAAKKTAEFGTVASQLTPLIEKLRPIMSVIGCQIFH